MSIPGLLAWVLFYEQRVGKGSGDRVWEPPS